MEDDMCGIAGVVSTRASPDELATAARRMVASLVHRGPDDLRAWTGDGVVLGHARLSILDIAGGRQPMADPQSGLRLVFNGEIYNYEELRRELAPRYSFQTRSDTEVLLAAWRTWGADCLPRLNGQFAFAVYDPRDRTLWLARDRVGIRPLFYAPLPGGLAFASEAKALFAANLVTPALDAAAIKQTLTLWAPAVPRSSFEGVSTLPPGSVARLRGGELSVSTWWTLDLADERLDAGARAREDEVVEELTALLDDAVRLRLRADVPVTAYLSGGLDSSLICALAQRQLKGALNTYSVQFSNAGYDEREFQALAADALATHHLTTEVGDADIGALLPDVVFHAEQPLIRSAPGPFLRLSRLVHDCGRKVVLTGEGADEMFLGYDLYRETMVRRFWARRPDSTMRPRLLERLYPYLPLARQGAPLLRQVFGEGLDDPEQPAFSHLIRWSNTGRISRFFSRSFAARVAGEDPAASALASLPVRIDSWRPLAKAQALEVYTLLTQYLLSAQGDRMLMGNSVEGRFPFLDHRVIELAASLPDRLKLRGLDEKHVLKRVGRQRVPAVILERKKFPYRAPIAGALVGAEAPDWVAHDLSANAIESVGVFDTDKTQRLLRKLSARPERASEADSMSLVAVASTQLLARRLLSPIPVDDQALQRVEVLS
jgi:asparagine synthase (glutamine-hydrolysing)